MEEEKKVIIQTQGGVRLSIQVDVIPIKDSDAESTVYAEEPHLTDEESGYYFTRIY